VNAALRDRYQSPLAARRLWLAVAVSLLLHGGLLAVHFSFPDASRAFQERALDIILVNSRSPRKPADAQVLAQANLDGGGNTEQDHRATTPLPPAPRHQDGDDLEQSQRRIQELEAHQQRLAAKARSRAVVAPKPDKEEQLAPTPPPSVSGRDLAHSALAMARLEGRSTRNSTSTTSARARRSSAPAPANTVSHNISRPGGARSSASARSTTPRRPGVSSTANW
jgi:protein TonB